MSFYIILFIVSLILSIIPKVRNYKVVLYICTSFLILFAAIRSLTVGTDTYNYFLAFKFPERELAYYSNSLEILYWWLIKFCGFFFNYDLYMLIVYSIILIPIACVINKESENKMLSLFLFICIGCYTASFNIMRQSIAISITFYAFYKYEKDENRHFKKVWYYHLLAFLFHGSSVLCLVLYLLKYINISKLLSIVVIIGSFIFGFFFSESLNEILNILSAYAGKYEGYFNMFSGGEDRNLLSNLGVNVMILSIVIFSSNSFKNTIPYWGCITYIILFNISGSMGYLVRIADYFLIFQIIAIPNVLNGIQNAIIKYGYYCFVLVYCSSIYFIRTLITNEIVPYAIRF